MSNYDPGGFVKLSILMPAHNEVQTIAEIVERVLTVPLDQEIVLVDDGSFDGTSEIVDKLASSRVKVIHHPSNQGKGAAVRTGLEAVTGDVIVIQDADLEYDPHDLVRLIVPISKGQADVVYGVRSLTSQKWLMRWGNGFVTWVTNLMYGQNLKDMETCYKMMRSEIAQSLDLECRGFDLEAEITSKLLRAGHAICELPISYTARYENKKLSPLDGLPTVRALWRYRRWRPQPVVSLSTE
ncbi:MAG: glycosyltransferase family 2 protein [Chloroflexi bacterium]|nr:glycosyltransferase family 2 protein [Chloroflexota bacterium]